MTDQLQWPAIDEEVLRTLPPVLRAVVKALGFARASQILDEYGGINHNIPKVKKIALGLDELELVRLRITMQPHMDAAGRIWLPKPDKLFMHVRNEQIFKNKSHISINRQALEYKLSNRQIMNIRKSLTKDERLSASSVKRNLVLDVDEIVALKCLAEEKLISATGNSIYAKILNKLNRAAIMTTPKAKLTQFDLF
ncbi:MAG: hypothetical protein ACO1N8_06310 [Methylophilus sp.]